MWKMQDNPTLLFLLSYIDYVIELPYIPDGDRKTKKND